MKYVPDFPAKSSPLLDSFTPYNAGQWNALHFGGGTQNTTSKSEPWAAAQPYLQTGMEEASRLYNKPGSLVAPLSDPTMEAISRTVARGTSGSPLSQEASNSLTSILGGQSAPNLGTLTSLQNATNPTQSLLGRLASGGNQQLDAVARGDYLMAGNPYLDANVKRATDTVADYTNAMFSNAGRVGSTAHQGTLGRNVGDVAASMYGANYDAERGRMDAAAGNAFNQRLTAGGMLAGLNADDLNRQMAAANSILGANQNFNSQRLAAAGLAPTLAANDYADINAILGAGNILDTQSQRELIDPWTKLNNYNGIIQGFGGLGGQTYGTQPGQSQFGSILGGAGGLMSGIAALAAL